jgi:GNAT superfamily N-acetyltransferase
MKPPSNPVASGVDRRAMVYTSRVMSESSSPTGHSDHLIIDTDRRKLDFELIHHFLGSSYWAAGIPREVVQRSIENSLCFGVYEGERQVGFARVITDYATFAWLADVFIVESHRGRGLSKRLMEAIFAEPRLQGLRRWMLATRDAHALYSRYGFRPLAAPDRMMERHDPDVYRRKRDAAAD